MTQTLLEALECPRCGDNYLYHGAVAAYTRKREDGPSRIVTMGDDEVFDIVDNPSARRNGLYIAVECETCHDVNFEGTEEERKLRPFLLTIVQHKGRTFIHWQMPDGTLRPVKFVV